MANLNIQHILTEKYLRVAFNAFDVDKCEEIKLETIENLFYPNGKEQLESEKRDLYQVFSDIDRENTGKVCFRCIHSFIDWL